MMRLIDGFDTENAVGPFGNALPVTAVGKGWIATYNLGYGSLSTTGLTNGVDVPIYGFGNYGAQAMNGSSSLLAQFDNQTAWTAGFSWCQRWGSRAGGFVMFQLLDAGTPQVTLSFENASNVTVANDWQLASGGTIFQRMPAPIFMDAWYFIEIHVFIDSSAGSYEVRLDNKTIMQGTNVNTQNSSHNTANQVYFGVPGGGGGAGVDGSIDNLYINDGQPGTSGFLGPCRVVTYWPGADANVSFTPDTGPSNWARVAHRAPDRSTGQDGGSPDDTAIGVASATPGALDLYTMTQVTPPPVAGTVVAVANNLYTRADPDYTLAVAVGSGDLTMTLNATPTLITLGTWVRLGDYEIVLCGYPVGPVVPIVRAQQGTTAGNYGIGTGVAALNTHQIETVMKEGSTQQTLHTYTVSEIYAAFVQIMESNPVTSAAWTLTDLATAEFGFESVTG